MIQNKTLWEQSYNEFSKVGSQLRPKSLFNWLSGAYQYLYLSSVDIELIPALADIKTTLCIVDVAIDDCCDNQGLIKKMGGEPFTYHNLRLLYGIDTTIKDKIGLEKEGINGLNEHGKEYYQNVQKIIKDVTNRIKVLPRFKDFQDELVFAFRRVGQAMEFSYLVNNSASIYPFSHVVRNRAPSTMVVVHSLIDVMASPSFKKEEVGKAMPLFNMADVVAMLANTINTWPREIIEKDYSSPVIALGLEKGIITFSDFKNGNQKELEEKLKSLDWDIDNEINNVLNEMRRYAETTEILSFDTKKYVENYAKVKEAFKARERYWEEGNSGAP